MQWEYKIEENLNEEMLNELGLARWELISVVHSMNTITSQLTYFFKRKL